MEITQKKFGNTIQFYNNDLECIAIIDKYNNTYKKLFNSQYYYEIRIIKTNEKKEMFKKTRTLKESKEFLYNNI